MTTTWEIAEAGTTTTSPSRRDADAGGQLMGMRLCPDDVADAMSDAMRAAGFHGVSAAPTEPEARAIAERAVAQFGFADQTRDGLVRSLAEITQGRARMWDLWRAAADEAIAQHVVDRL